MALLLFLLHNIVSKIVIFAGLKSKHLLTNILKVKRDASSSKNFGLAGCSLSTYSASANIIRYGIFLKDVSKNSGRVVNRELPSRFTLTVDLLFIHRIKQLFLDEHHTKWFWAISIYWILTELVLCWEKNNYFFLCKLNELM